MIDCVVVGAGHNGLVTAAYLARAGRSVLVLEAADHVGGAAISAEVFPGLPARLSKYSYLVSLLPAKVAEDLDIRVPLARRRISSYTPDPGDPSRGVLIPSDDQAGVREAIEHFTGRSDQADAWIDFYARTERMAQVLFPTLLQPLMDVTDVREQIDPDDWRDFVERPLGEVIESTFDDDLLRGIVLTDGLIGTYAKAHDRSLHQNICFLYHVIGQGTGQWDVPIGGMGAITEQLAERITEAGGQILTSTPVTELTEVADGYVVTAWHEGSEQQWRCRTVAAGLAPAELNRIRGQKVDAIDDLAGGAQVKVNMLLSRLPRLRDANVRPEDAFAGTFHINEGYRQLDSAYLAAESGRLPAPLPAEIYCHSLTDPSILGDSLQVSGAQTLTLFGLHTPHSLADRTTALNTDTIIDAVQATLDSVLAEPIADCLMHDAQGRPCIEVNTTLDLERDLRIPTGNIFHTPLSWPWAMSAGEVGTWGVETDSPGLALCGSGAVRGGGVSGIPGHNAAQFLTGVLDSHE